MCNNLFKDRRILYIVLVCIIASILSLSIVYAALSTILDINGSAEISAANWNIYLNNIQLNSNSVTSNIPIINDSRTVSFSTTLSKPGDFYEFTVDVVNAGSIDALIEKIEVICDITAEQKKYINMDSEDINKRFDYKYYDVNKFKYVRSGLLYEFNINSIYNNTLFSNIGASIPLKISFLGSVNSNIEIKTKDYGINNLIVEAYLNINVKCYTTMPLGSKIHEISINELIFVDIIKGEIPNYYISDVK